MIRSRFMAWFTGAALAVPALAQNAPAQPAPAGPAVTVINPVSSPVPVAVQGPVAVQNLPLAADGSVRTTATVPALPLAADGSVRTTPGTRVLRDGWDIISFESAFPRSLDVPEGVVLTDFVIELAISFDGQPCFVWFFKIENDAIGPLFTPRVTAASPFAEMHFHSGMRSTAERKLGFFVNANCRVNVLWTGYEG